MKSNIRKLPEIIGFISGVIFGNLYVYIVGCLAAIAVPRQFFLWFGRHYVAALSVDELFTVAIPLFLISAVWTTSTVFIFRAHYRRIAMWCLCGYSLTWVIVMLAYESPIFNIAVYTQQPWIILTMIAAPCGIVASGYFLSKLSHYRWST